MMRCVDIRKKLSAYIDEELSLRERRLIKKHLELCRHCAEEEKQLLLLSSFVGITSDNVVSLSFTERVINKIRSRRKESDAIPFFRAILAGFFIIIFLMASIAGFNSSRNGSADNYDELRDFDDFPPESFSRIFMDTVKEK
jgi:anti-sigma factor RsiW